MKKLKYLVTILCCIGTMTACDYLDIKPSEVTSDEKIFSDIITAEKVLGRLYWLMYWDHGGLRRDGFYSELGACTDELVDHWESPVSRYLYNNGAWGPTNNPLGEWAHSYDFIRRSNVFLANIDNVVLTGDQEKNYGDRIKTYKYEARFIRAFIYFDLFRTHGPVPIIEDIISIADIESTHRARNSVTELVDYLCTELDEIAPYLPDKYSTQELGRITKGACYALKSRLLLYAASPLHNGNTMYAEVVNKDGKQLFPQTYDKELWKRAAEAAQTTIDWAPKGEIELEKVRPTDPVYSYAKVFFENTRNKEIILPGLLGTDMLNDRNNTPNASDYNGVGKYSVLQSMIDSYETANGYLPFKMDDDGCIIYDAQGRPTINPESGYTEEGFWDGESHDGLKLVNVKSVSNMYKNRDPRFYASISFDQTYWKSHMVNRPLSFGFWHNNSDDNFEGNKKLIGKSNETGYSVRKFLDPNVNLKISWSTSHHWPYYRLAEQYLNCAEAWNEYLDKPDQRVYNAINAVRARVDMPPLPITAEDETKIGMRKRIRNERRVELFYENHRYYDVRRWMIGKKVDNGTIYGMNSLPEMTELEAAAAANGWDMKIPAESKLAGTAVFYKRTPYMKRVFEDKHYLFPIPQTEMDKNPNMVQNYGWEADD